MGVSALVSLDQQQQWLGTQTEDVNIGIAGKALTLPGSRLPGGFWISNNFNAEPGVTQCQVQAIEMTCPSGDPFFNGLFSGSIECRNGQIPGPITPATATFYVGCT